MATCKPSKPRKRTVPVGSAPEPVDDDLSLLLDLKDLKDSGSSSR